ncbi:hypothetical protein HYH03_014515 [Edaphochlamys debaryana]|uniref:Uncharacterized protein n=1 Tax=Edaphochlamys debaryana TaxID=47281 RepID=A0A835XNW8_9CHLO|nr:hypothetical protein HYH03_014515 [Edaphochlamys debaryana]|eukprot:KAG2486832.1 hypothetical protein HYH03_014515 [Edaphochlamys debaryana]
MGFPTRPPEDFLKSGQGLDLGQRNRLRAHLRKFPVNTEPPFVPGTGGIVLSPGPPAGRRRPASATAASSASLFACTRQPLPASLLRIYYDNGTLDFVAVRWRGSRADSLVWARAVTKGQDSSAHQRDYTAWSPELPSELDVATWLPVFLDGIREYDEPYRFLAVRGSEELLYKAGDTIHTFAESLVLPLKLALDTREPTAVAVALQLMGAALALDPGVAGRWVPAYWQFAQVLNLFRARGGALAVDMGYNRRTVATCRQLATDFMTAFELAGGPAATAAVRRYSPSFDPAVTDSSMARAAAKAAVKAQEAGLPAGGFRPFTLF